MSGLNVTLGNGASLLAVMGVLGSSRLEKRDLRRWIALWILVNKHNTLESQSDRTEK